MKPASKLLTLIGMIMVLGAFSAAGPAAAATGSGDMDLIIDGTQCQVTFDWNTGAGNPAPPAGSPATLSSFGTSGCSASIAEPPTTLTVSFAFGGAAWVSGVIQVRTFGIDCRYNVPGMSGTYSGANPVETFVSGHLNKSFGSFLCPSPVLVGIGAYFHV
ncbi:MAG TPA: hypothetical protein VMF31_01260 [Solirubrobacterales bacterium]|nr:hypothetical protein [Solirubrobacterales bacterium]